MAGYLSGQEYQALLEEVKQGSASLHITRHTAREFFLRVTSKEVSETLGYSVFPQKATVLSLLLLSVLLILTCLALIVMDQGWLAMVSVPLVGIFWTILAGFTTELGSTVSSTVILAFVLGFVWFLPASYQQPVILFALSIYIYRMGHVLAQFFLLRIVTASYRAWDMLAEHIDIRRHETRPLP